MSVSSLSSPLLRVEDLSVRYAIHSSVLDGLDLEMRRGESIGVFGESGSCKTTLARAIAGLLPPGAVPSGTVSFRGQTLPNQNSTAWRKLRGSVVAFLSQEPSISLTPHRRIGSQIAEVISVHRRSGEEAALDVLRRFIPQGTSRIARSYPHELSGGERQRAAIARAVCCDPELFIADEPTASLDSIAQRDVLNVFRDLQERSGIALLMISHHRRALSYTTSRQVRLAAGRLEAQ